MPKPIEGLLLIRW